MSSSLSLLGTVLKRLLIKTQSGELNEYTPRFSANASDMEKIDNTTAAPSVVRGGLDEKNEVYMKAVALEEGQEDESTDLEANQAPRPQARLHTLKISIAIMLVIITQSLGVSKVRDLYYAS